LPPLTGVALKVTVLPPHTTVLLAVILTAGVTLGEMLTVIWLEPTTVGAAQLALLVSSQVTTSPFANDDDE
jgi:hypothetical protein